jgi:leader peptidase (prepilin peptidase)/N-methyltransferase
MPAAFIVSWTGTGFLIGTALGAFYRRLLTSAPAGLRAARIAAPPLTALAFGGLAWRFGHQFDLLPYSVLAALGVALGLIDLIEQRLPSLLIYPGIALVSVLLTTSAILHSRGPDLLRALAGMAILAAFYLVLALVSGGGLGAGDVKLGGLLGLALGWLSWSALLTATFLGWFAAALIWLLLRITRRQPRDALLPMGPFLLVGALATISLTSI